MKRTYTPTLESLSAQHGECYFTVSVGRRHCKHEAFLEYGTLEDIVNMMDATIFCIDPDAHDLDRWSARISYEGRDLVTMPDCAGPDSARVCSQPACDRNAA